MIRLLFFIICLSATALLYAQEQMPAEDTNWKHLYRPEATRINDLVNTKLDVRFEFSKSYMYGKEWLTLHPHFYATDSLTLDAKGMNINEVSLVTGSKKTPLKYIYDSMFLRIQLGKSFKSSENYTVYIDYVSKPDEWVEEGSSAIAGAKGLYFINPKGEDSSKPTEIWTQGETEHNSVWMPTIDKPNQKSTEEISMTVPAKYITLGNGLLVNKKVNTDGTRTDTWKMDLPHAPYLFFMGVGDYSVVKDSYKGKEVAYYVEKKYEPVARKIFGHTPEMIRFYSQTLGIDYPWAKYNQIVGRDYVSGAMENTTATLHGEGAYQDARQLTDENTWEDVIAHELFHQWFGDYVTTESWSNITVNESFADFSETIWNEYKYGQDKGDETNYNAMQQYLRSGKDSVTLVRFYYKDKEDVFDAVSYPKGGRVLNQLRWYLGNDAFYASLNKYLTDNKFGNGEAQKLRLAFESITGQDLNWYWNEWYYGAGHPVFNISYSYDEANKRSMVTVQQTQNTPAFKMPVTIDVYEGAQKQRYNVWVQNRTDTFSFPYSKHPDLINFDGNKILLCEKTDNKTADNFIAQWKYAPLYMDRREAIEYFAKNKMTYELSLGLKDKYPGLRILTLTYLSKDSGALANTTIHQTVKNMVMNDSAALVKASALKYLTVTKDADNQPLFEKYVNDSSYSVSGAALTGLGNFDSAKALSLARSFQPTAKDDLLTASSVVFIKYGDENDYEIIASSYGDLPANQAKFNLTPAFCNYLSKLDDTTKIKAGIDMVIGFRNQVPEPYRTAQVENYFKSNLDKIAAAKGDAIAVYIQQNYK